MILDIWGKNLVTLKLRGEFGFLDIKGQNVFLIEAKNTPPTPLGKVDMFLSNFKALAQKIPLENMRRGQTKFGGNSASEISVLDFMMALDEKDLWTVWASFALEPFLSDETRMGFLRAGPRRAEKSLVLYDKTSGVCVFEGTFVEFFLGSMTSRFSLLPKEVILQGFLNNFLRGVFPDEPQYGHNASAALPFFTEALKTKTKNIDFCCSIFFEYEETTKNITKNPLFWSFWADRGQECAESVINSVLVSDMSQNDKRLVTQNLFKDWSDTDKKLLWAKVHPKHLLVRGLFYSWFSVARGLGFSNNTIATLSRSLLRQAIFEHADRPKEWAKHARNMHGSGVFTVQEETQFCLSLWGKICDKPSHDHNVSSFLPKLQKSEPEWKALIDYGFLPKTFDPSSFLAVFSKQIDDIKQNKSYTSYGGMPIKKFYDEGRILIEKSFLEDTLFDITAKKEHSKTPKRKM